MRCLNVHQGCCCHWLTWINVCHLCHRWLISSVWNNQILHWNSLAVVCHSEMCRKKHRPARALTHAISCVVFWSWFVDFQEEAIKETCFVPWVSNGIQLTVAQQLDAPPLACFRSFFTFMLLCRNTDKNASCVTMSQSPELTNDPDCHVKLITLKEEGKEQTWNSLLNNITGTLHSPFFLKIFSIKVCCKHFGRLNKSALAWEMNSLRCAK